MPYGLSPGTASGKGVACRIVRRRIACGTVRRVGMVVVCRIVPRRIACGTVPRRSASHHGSARVGDLTSLPCPRSGERNTRRRPYPGPTAACSRRRHRRFANIYSFVQPPRFIVAHSAARLRRIVGPLASRYIVPNRPRNRRDGAVKTEENISGPIRAYPGLSGPIRAYPGTHTSWGKKRLVACGIARRRIVCHQARRGGNGPSPDRVRRARRRGWSSRAVSPLAGHRGCQAHRVPYRPSPDRVHRTRRVPYRPVPDRVRYGPSPDHVSSCPCPCRHPQCPCRGHG